MLSLYQTPKAQPYLFCHLPWSECSIIILVCLSLISFLCVACLGDISEGCLSKSKKGCSPNIIFILADDLGYGDLGCFGQKKIETPNIDSLCREGMRFTSHYSGAAVCAPSRCALLTGKHSGHSFIRGNDEWCERGAVFDYEAVYADPALEGQRPLPINTVTMSALLRSIGYRTACVGKWGLGAPGTEGEPNRQGFDFFFGYNCQRQAHTYYPRHLYRNRERVLLRNPSVAPSTRLEPGADPLVIASYRRYMLTDYAPDLMFDEMRTFVSDNRANPFFLYWATPIPHVPLQAPKRWVDYYVRKFGDELPYLGNKSYFPHRYPHAAYAAMISYLDEQVGELVTHLKSLGLYENTLIVFTSDNGPTYNGGSDSVWFESAGPFSAIQGRGKGSLYEGGIRVPLIAVWPGHIKAGVQSDLPCAFWDWLPTLCDVAGTSAPDDVDGISLLPTLLGYAGQKEHAYLYWEYPEKEGQQALRQGRWKALRKNLRKQSAATELFDLQNDHQESINLAGDYPDKVAQMERLMSEVRRSPELKAFRLPGID